MHRRRRDPRGRGLPHRWPDLIRQLVPFGAAYGLYEVVRALVGNGAAQATQDATRVIELERRLRVFVEPAVQAWTAHRPWLMDLTGWAYLNAQTVVTIGALLFIYARRADSFPFVRNMFMVAMALALVGYAVYPTAPPRLMPQWGFTDPIRRLTGIDAERGLGNVLINPYAAIPSMHICFALMSAAAMARLARRRAVRLAWRLYPPAIAFVVIATGNHYLCDIVAGALTAGASALVAHALRLRARPDAWTLRRRRRRAPPADGDLRRPAHPRAAGT